MKDGRKYIRRRASEYLMVTDRASALLLGRMINISPTGIMIFGPDPLEVGRSYQLDIKLPKGVFEAADLCLTAACRWSKFKKSSELWESGLEIQEITQDNRKVLQQVVLSLMTHNGECRQSEDSKRTGKPEKIELVRVLRYK